MRDTFYPLIRQTYFINCHELTDSIRRSTYTVRIQFSNMKYNLKTEAFGKKTSETTSEIWTYHITFTAKNVQYKSCKCYRVNVYNIAIYFSPASNSLLCIVETVRELSSIRTLEAGSVVDPANDLRKEHCLLTSSKRESRVLQQLWNFGFITVI